MRQISFGFHIPEDAVNLATNKEYVLGQCSWASLEEIHICKCHQTTSKLKIGLLTRELPKETNLVQEKWWTNKNEIHIIYTDRQGNNPKEFVWIWNGKQFKLIR